MRHKIDRLVLGILVALLWSQAFGGEAAFEPTYFGDGFVFLGNKKGKIYTLTVDLHRVSLPGGPVAQYEGALGIDGRWSALPSLSEPLPGADPQSMASLLIYRVDRLPEGAYRLRIEGEELKRIALEVAKPEARAPLLQMESVSQTQFFARATLTIDGDAVEGRVVHEQLVQRGVNPFAESPASRFGRYERFSLFSPGGAIYLLSLDQRQGAVEPQRALRRDFSVAMAGGASRVLGPPQVRWSLTTYQLPADRDIPEEWELVVADLGLKGTLKDIGHMVDHGHLPGTRSFWLYGVFTVVGQVSIQGKTQPIWGVVQHIQEDAAKK
jgi:hypothetical protein